MICLRRLAAHRSLRYLRFSAFSFSRVCSSSSTDFSSGDEGNETNAKGVPDDGMMLASMLTHLGTPTQTQAPAKPAQAKPAQTKPTQAKPAQAKPALAKPAQAKPSLSQPTQAQAAKPALAQPAQTKPALNQPTQAKPASVQPGQAKASSPKPAKPAAKWQKNWDETYQLHYYFNPETGESSWELPDGMVE